MVLTKPFYTLDEITIQRIIDIAYACQNLNLGNFSFQYYPVSDRPGVTFFMSERVANWDLTVKSTTPDQRDAMFDCYVVHLDTMRDDARIVYSHSE